MEKIALIVIYNHRYDRNIPLIEKLYGKRFSHIFHLVPFYDGELKNVIPVYQNSFYFEGYIAQGFNVFYREEFTHYFFIADDMIIHPLINETNLCEHLKLGRHTCFLPRLTSVGENPGFWGWAKSVYDFSLSKRGIEVQHELPDAGTAKEKMKKFGMENLPLSPEQLYTWRSFVKSASRLTSVWKTLQYGVLKAKNCVLPKSYMMPYPLVRSYSDICVVSADAIKSFAHYCGVFAALDLFVEVALPTALVLSAEEIRTEKELEFRGRALWTSKDMEILEVYDRDIEKLLAGFPDKYLYLHPVKLSKWIIK